MNLNQRIASTLSSLNHPVEFGKYEGVLDKYFVFNFADERGDNYSDDGPGNETTAIQIHFFAPKTFNHLLVKKSVKSLLFAGGFTYPSVQTIYEDDTKLFHLIFETEYTGGIE